jgi:hypothetical protein
MTSLQAHPPPADFSSSAICYAEWLSFRVQDKTYHLIEKAAIGDWFLIFLISRNMDSVM